MTHIAKNSKHPFQSIEILHRTDLLVKLKDLVTLDPKGEIKRASGVPRNVVLMKRITTTFEKLAST